MVSPLRVSDMFARWPRNFAASSLCTAMIASYAAFASAQTDSEVHYYSTAAPPSDYPGPTPTKSDSIAGLNPKSAVSTPIPVETPKRITSAIPEVPSRLPRLKAEVKVEPPALVDPIFEAKAAIASCAQTYVGINDYTCMFYKRERIDGKMSSMNAMHMKSRTRPQSTYFKFVQPNAGREAIYVAGSFHGKAVVHDVGIGKILAGTLKLDPKSATAMEDNRHPITDAGLGHMIETISTAWNKELRPGESKVVLYPGARVSGRSCLMIESVHPIKQSGHLFHMVKVYIDKEHNLPIRFEAYDWPKNGRAPELIEEYTYSNLKLNLGLTSHDFDPNNKNYSFGRF